MEVLPSHLRVRPMGSRPRDPRPFLGLMAGEVLAVIYPDSDQSVSGRYVEYRVAAQAYVDGQPATIELPHAVLQDDLFGSVDTGTQILRADPQAGKDGQPGTGSKVLVQCINGDPASAVIVGGARSLEPDDLTEDDGVVWRRTFNGVSVSIDGDGAVEIRRDGPQTNDGELDDDRSDTDSIGQRIVLEADGSIEISTNRGEDVEQRIRLDHADKTMSIETSDGLTVQAKKGPVTLEAADDGIALTAHKDDVAIESEKADVTIKAPSGQVALGGSGQEPVPLGDTLVNLLNQILTAIQAISVPTAVGPSGPPLNAPAFQSIAQALETCKSKAVFVGAGPS